MEGDRRMSVVELERRPSFGAVSPGSGSEGQPPLFTPSTTTLQPPKISVDNTNEEEIHGKLSIPDDGKFIFFLDCFPFSSLVFHFFILHIYVYALTHPKHSTHNTSWHIFVVKGFRSKKSYLYKNVPDPSLHTNDCKLQEFWIKTRNDLF